MPNDTHSSLVWELPANRLIQVGLFTALICSFLTQFSAFACREILGIQVSTSVFRS